MKTFRKFISEKKREQVNFTDVNISDPCDVVFEKSIFYAVSKEQDTDVESDIWNAVTNWIHGSRDYSRIIPYYRKLIQCKGTYKALNPNVSTIYRGLCVPISQALKMISLNKATSKSGAEISGGGLKLIGHPGVYTPQKSVESWTSKLSAATQFATGEKDTGGGVGWEGLGEFKDAMRELTYDMRKIDYHSEQLPKAKSIAKGGSRGKSKEAHSNYIQIHKDALKQGAAYDISGVLGKHTQIPIIYSAPTDDNCVLNPTFSNELLKVVLGIGDEYEITRIGKTPIKGMVYFPKDLLVAIDMMMEFNTELKVAGYAYQIKSPLLPKK